METNGPASPESILIIEDDALLREIMRKKFGDTYTLLESTNGEDALKKAEALQPRLIILDLVLPGMDGFQILEQLKKDGRTAAIPVFILSNFGEQEDIERSKSMGANRYFIKAHTRPTQIADEVKAFLDHPGGTHA